MYRDIDNSNYIEVIGASGFVLFLFVASITIVYISCRVICFNRYKEDMFIKIMVWIIIFIIPGIVVLDITIPGIMWVIRV